MEKKNFNSFLKMNVNENTENFDQLCPVPKKYNSTDELVNDNAPNLIVEINPDIIKIYVYQPCIRIRYIRLNRNSPISILSTIYNKNSIYIYQGRILDMGKSFKESNIMNNNKILLLPSSINETSPNFIKKWLFLTSNQESFENRIEINMQNGSQREIARLKDLKRSKLENKRSFLNKCIISQLLQKKNSRESLNTQNLQLNINYNQTESPSNEPLPIIWQ